MSPSEPAGRAETAFPVYAWTALLVAVLTSVGSLMLSLGEAKVACPLCFYQRSFAFGLVAVLAVGLSGRDAVGPRVALLALPLAVGGLGVAAFHVSLEVREKLECPPGLFDVLTAPKQSLAAFGVLSLLLLVEAVRGLTSGSVGAARLIAALLLGGAIAWGSTAANPPPLPVPPEPYKDVVPKTCRPPYRGATL